MRQIFHASQIVLLVSHSLEQVQNLCNRVIVLNKGEIVAQGATDEMITFYQRNYVN